MQTLKLLISRFRPPSHIVVDSNNRIYWQFVGGRQRSVVTCGVCHTKLIRRWASPFATCPNGDWNHGWVKYQEETRRESA